MIPYVPMYLQSVQGKRISTLRRAKALSEAPNVITLVVPLASLLFSGFRCTIHRNSFQRRSKS